MLLTYSYEVGMVWMAGKIVEYVAYFVEYVAYLFY